MHTLRSAAHPRAGCVLSARPRRLAALAHRGVSALRLVRERMHLRARRPSYPRGYVDSSVNVLDTVQITGNGITVLLHCIQIVELVSCPKQVYNGPESDTPQLEGTRETFLIPRSATQPVGLRFFRNLQ